MPSSDSRVTEARINARSLWQEYEEAPFSQALRWTALATNDLPAGLRGKPLQQWCIGAMTDIDAIKSQRSWDRDLMRVIHPGLAAAESSLSKALAVMRDSIDSAAQPKLLSNKATVAASQLVSTAFKGPCAAADPSHSVPDRGASAYREVKLAGWSAGLSGGARPDGTALLLDK